jgi:hypoxanthine phosphoribosyltransferase
MSHELKNQKHELQELQRVQANATCLHSKQEVEAVLDTMAAKITLSLESANPLLMCVMSGGLIITGCLLPRLNFPLQLDYVHATRYRNKTSGAELEWKQYPHCDLSGRTVLVLDDILDEGATLDAIAQYCRDAGAEQVLIAVLVEKKHDHKLSAIKADFVGLTAPDQYLFGYGMDYKGYLRNADGIYAVAERDLD